MTAPTSVEIKPLIRKLVTRADLSPEEAAQAFDSMLCGHLTEAESSAFLIALAMKGETAPEITAAAASIKKHSVRLSPKTLYPIVDTCGTGGDFQSTFNISTAAAIVASAAGAIIAKHGNRSSSGLCGSADFMEAIGFKLDSKPSQVLASIEKIGLGFLFAPTFHPSMRNVSAVRRAIGVRTVFNVAGPLCNPCENLSGQVVGVYSQALAATLEQVFAASGTTAMIVNASDGLDELSTTCTNSVVWIHDKIKESCRISPQDVGISIGSISDLRVASKNESIAETLRVIYGLADKSKEDIVTLNAAAALLVSKSCKSFEDGITKSRRAIADGTARLQLSRLIELCGEPEGLQSAEKKFLSL